jgi:hypothetical protein
LLKELPMPDDYSKALIERTEKLALVADFEIAF